MSFTSGHYQFVKMVKEMGVLMLRNNAKPILILDDDVTQAVFLREVLVQSGYQAVVVNSVHEATDFLQTTEFSLIVSDVNIARNSDGFDFLRTVRSMNFQIPFALITGRKNKDDVDLLVRLGADDLIPKPIDVDLFLAKAKRLLGDFSEDTRFFAEKSLARLGKSGEEFLIAKISEEGVHVEGPVPMAKNEKIKIVSKFFDEIGIEIPWLRVNSCVRKGSSKKVYSSHLSFVGLMESESRKIRSWIVQHPEGRRYADH